MKKIILLILTISPLLTACSLIQKGTSAVTDCTTENQTYDERTYAKCCPGLVGVPNPPDETGNAFIRECEKDLSSQGIEY